MPACAVDEQKAEFDADDGNGESDAGPVELLQFVGRSVRHGEEKEGQQDDAERDRVGDEEGDAEVDIGWRALGDEMVQRAGANREGDGKVKEEHGFSF